MSKPAAAKTSYPRWNSMLNRAFKRRSNQTALEIAVGILDRTGCTITSQRKCHDDQIIRAKVTRPDIDPAAIRDEIMIALTFEGHENLVTAVNNRIRVQLSVTDKHPETDLFNPDFCPCA